MELQRQLPWYAIRVKSRHEKLAARHLAARGYEQLLPLYRSCRVWKTHHSRADLPLFDGYVFCRLDVGRRLPVLTAPGVLYIVSNHIGPAAIDAGEMESLLAMVHSRLPLSPEPELPPGIPVQVISGPLTGASGVVAGSSTSTRLVVTISLLQRSIAVEVERHWLRPTAAAMKPYPLFAFLKAS